MLKFNAQLWYNRVVNYCTSRNSWHHSVIYISSSALSITCNLLPVPVQLNLSYRRLLLTMFHLLAAFCPLLHTYLSMHVSFLSSYLSPCRSIYWLNVVFYWYSITMVIHETIFSNWWEHYWYGRGEVQDMDIGQFSRNANWYTCKTVH